MITNNVTLKEMGTILAGAKSVLLVSHVNPDPDAMGSGMALCRALRRQGVEAWLLLDEPLPEYLQFLLKRPANEDAVSDPGLDPDGITVTTDHQVIESPQISLCIDCSEESRYDRRLDAFQAGEITCCIDHHNPRSPQYDHYYIDPQACAASQIVYQLIREMDWPVTDLIAEELYTGISGDTGNFMHPNTTPQVHRIAADLMEYDFDMNEIGINLYQSKSPEEIRVQVRALQSMEMLAGGKAVMTRMSREDFEECQAQVDDSENLIDEIRVIRGAEIAAFVKEDGDQVRGSLRSKTWGNVLEIARKFGGGGHVRAAGFRTEESLDETYEKLRREIISVVESSK